MDELTFTLNSPLTEEDWDAINDVDFDATNEITFHTKHGKEVTFVKQRTAHWKYIAPSCYQCDCCGAVNVKPANYCMDCGCAMEKEQLSE